MSSSAGIIGSPVLHSVSPAFQQAAFDHCGLDITYNSWDVSARNLQGFVETTIPSIGDLLGFNVTVPHKESIISWLDTVSTEAAMAGAVNTVVLKRGSLFGYNTDGPGFVRSLTINGDFAPHDKNVLILGSGGAARGVAAALISAGARSIVIINRTLDRARHVSQDLEPLSRSISVLSSTPTNLRRAAGSADLIVNCTTIGMLYGPDERGTLIKAKDIPPTALVYDLVYNPLETPLLKEAKKAKARAMGGLSMLVYQGAIAFELWTGTTAPIEVMLKAARHSLEIDAHGDIQ